MNELEYNAKCEICINHAISRFFSHQQIASQCFKTLYSYFACTAIGQQCFCFENKIYRIRDASHFFLILTENDLQTMYGCHWQTEIVPTVIGPFDIGKRSFDVNRPFFTHTPLLCTTIQCHLSSTRTHSRTYCLYIQ